MSTFLKENFGRYGRFELYSITIERLERDVQTINLTNPYWGEDTVYTKQPEEEIPLGKPLLLTGPARPCSPPDSVFITLGDPKGFWKFHVNMTKEEASEEEDKEIYIGCTQKVLLVDIGSDSRALICYAMLIEAVDAQLELIYQGGDQNMNIQIIKGEIFSITEGDDCTKRVLWSFDPTETSKSKSASLPRKNHRSTSYELYSGDSMNLYRPLIGLPLKSALRVSVNLEYCLVPTTKTRNPTEKKTQIPCEMVPRMINESRSFDVPEYESGSFDVPESALDAPPAVFYLSDDHGDQAARLILTVKWTDNMDDEIDADSDPVFEQFEKEFRDSGYAKQLEELEKTFKDLSSEELEKMLKDMSTDPNLEVSSSDDDVNVSTKASASAYVQVSANANLGLEDEFPYLPTNEDFYFNFEQLEDPKVRVQKDGLFIPRELTDSKVPLPKGYSASEEELQYSKVPVAGVFTPPTPEPEVTNT